MLRHLPLLLQACSRQPGTAAWSAPYGASQLLPSAVFTHAGFSAKAQSQPDVPAIDATVTTVTELLQLPPAASTRLLHFLQRRLRAHDSDSDSVPDVSPQHAQASISYLTSQLGLATSDVANIYTRHPSLLLASADQHIQPLSTYLHTTLSFTPAQTRDAILKRPEVLLVPPAQIDAMLSYFASMGIPTERLAAAMAAHPPIMTARLDDLMNNLAFLLGSKFTPPEISDMLAASPRWLTLPIAELTAKWAFFSKHMKGRQMDLVLWPQLLERDLLNTLGPRTGFAKKKRLKMLMPSYCWGHPLLQNRAMWRDNMVVPVLWYMTAAPGAFCELFGFSAEEYGRYKRCWVLTMGQQWRMQLYGTSLSPAEAYNLFREGL